MATVFSHTHFCPTCNDMWKCVSWKCEGENGERTLPTLPCQRTDSEPAFPAASEEAPERPTPIPQVCSQGTSKGDKVGTSQDVACSNRRALFSLLDMSAGTMLLVLRQLIPRHR